MVHPVYIHTYIHNPISRRRKGDMNKFYTEDSQIWSDQVNFTVTWRFLHIALELICISVGKKKICDNYTEDTLSVILMYINSQTTAVYSGISYQ